MQPVQPTLPQGALPSRPIPLAASLAALIDSRARAGHEADGPGSTGATSPDGTVLVWLDRPKPESGPAAGTRRGAILVMHGASYAVTEQSFVVSFPVETGGKRRQLAAVSDLLATMGWSLLASKRRKTEPGHADTAVLINTRRFDGEQRLWLAEPVEASGQPTAPELRPWAAAGPDAGSGVTA